MDIAARISTGQAMPDGTSSDFHGPADVLVANFEDAPGSTIRSRFLAAGGDASRLHILGEVVRTRDGINESHSWSTPDDLAELRDRITSDHIKLVILDPALEFVSSSLNSLNNADVRAAFGPLIHLMAETDCTILLLRHLTKGVGASAIYRGQGAGSLLAVSRSQLIVGPDLGDECGKRHVLAHSKSNLGTKSPSLGYELIDHPEYRCASVKWTGVVEISANQLLGPAPDSEEFSARRDARDVLLGLTERQPILISRARTVIKAELGGIPDRTLRRAAKDAGLVSLRSPGFPPGWYWARQEQDLASLATDENNDECGQTGNAGKTPENLTSDASVATPPDMATLDETRPKDLSSVDEGMTQ
jgi:hypothetical protein